jgi:hypothetical protein
MRLKIDITTVKFRVAGTARPRAISKMDQRQKTTLPSDGSRPIWTVRLSAIDAQAGTSEQIFVDVAGDMPQLAVDEIATVHNLTFAPWAAVEFVEGKPKGKVMRSYRADAVTVDSGSSRRSA